MKLSILQRALLQPHRVSSWTAIIKERWFSKSRDTLSGATHEAAAAVDFTLMTASQEPEARSSSWTTVSIATIQMSIATIPAEDAEVGIVGCFAQARSAGSSVQFHGSCRGAPFILYISGEVDLKYKAGRSLALHNTTAARYVAERDALRVLPGTTSSFHIGTFGNLPLMWRVRHKSRLENHERRSHLPAALR